uniref:triacylglycerol lipase n=1 Tax=Gopherus evgoodei TaxID=1825980 RepID=A0A8C4YNW3_9SAUR
AFKEVEVSSLCSYDTVAELLKKEELAQAQKLQVKFNLRSSTLPRDEGCFLSIGQDKCLEDCKFNLTAKTFFIIHGWTMSGMFENWLESLVDALQKREKDANVVVVDWLGLAHQLYTDAVNNTKVVGKAVARVLNWLQEKQNLRLKNVHLIGYSLGAHVAGYAGNYAHGTIGRITGLDPAGPMFEGADPHRRLSPDDADFVDVLHTFTKETLGLSIGIQMPVGHIDVYPNGGDFQPGCGLSDVLGAIAYGSKCEHERAVHLFVDSLVNQDKQSFAFQCTDSSRFKKGICLSCRKNRCNSIGYNAKKMRNKRNSKMYLKTRADMPYRVYHYQMKMHIFSYKSLGETEPTFSVTLHGRMLSLCLFFRLEQISLNSTSPFLVYTEEDIGDLLRIKLTWEGSSQSWYIELTFCAEDLQLTNISPGNDLWFVKCRNGWPKKTEQGRALIKCLPFAILLSKAGFSNLSEVVCRVFIYSL